MKTIDDRLLTATEASLVEAGLLDGRLTVRRALARRGLRGVDLMGVSWHPEPLPERRQIERPIAARRVPWWQPYQRRVAAWAVALGLIFLSGMLMGRGL